MILLLVGVLLLPSLCTCCTDGTACNSSAVTNGTCVRGTCMASIPSMPRENLTLSIVVKYPENVMTTKGGSQMYIRGNGLGLRWDKGKLLQRTSPDTWSLKITYTSNLAGYRCRECADESLVTGEKLEYRILVDDRVDMVGANFAVDLPESKASAYFSKTREFFSYPWFYQTKGNLSAIVVDSGSLGGNRTIALYKPPSYFENVYKEYPVIFALDFDGQTLNIPQHLLDDPISKYAATEEYVVIGFGDYNQTERMNILTPSEHDYFECKNGSFLDNCGGCYSVNDSENLLAWLDLMIHKCGNLVPTGGAGNAVIDFLVSKVLPTVQKLSKNRLSTAREDIGIVGYSLGGLMSCHAAWTRPQDFGFAGCQSSSFWWPIVFTNATALPGFEFLNDTMKNTSLNSNRPPQRIYIDAGDLEDGVPFRMAWAAVEAADKMTGLNGYDLDRNVWVNVYPGAVHSSLEWLLRLWKALKTLLPAKGKPAMPKSEVPSFVGHNVNDNHTAWMLATLSMCGRYKRPAWWSRQLRGSF